MEEPMPEELTLSADGAMGKGTDEAENGGTGDWLTSREEVGGSMRRDAGEGERLRWRKGLSERESALIQAWERRKARGLGRGAGGARGSAKSMRRSSSCMDFGGGCSAGKHNETIMWAEEESPLMHDILRRQAGGDGLGCRSVHALVTEDDVEEVRGCIDLGFDVLNHRCLPQLRNTLPALRHCCSISYSRRLQALAAPSHQPPAPAAHAAAIQDNSKISNPGDDPEQVKDRLKEWAQTIATNLLKDTNGHNQPTYYFM